MNFQITTAERKSAPITAAFFGPSGSGKTYSALLFARGLVGPEGRIGIIDTEGRRSLIYADDPKIGGYRHLDMPAPYSPEACIAAFDAAVADGWNCIIFDSASLEHDGEGGLLDLAEQEAEALNEKNPNNRAISTQKWTRPKLRHRKFLNHAAGLPAHVIFTFRQVLTTDFSAKPPATVLTEVAEKNSKFVLELHAYFDADHVATWTRVPEPFRRFIPQHSLVTAEMGAAIAGNAPIAQSGLTPDDVIEWLDSEHINDEEFEGIFERLKKPLPEHWQRNLSGKQCEWILSHAGKSTILSKRNGI